MLTLAIISREDAKRAGLPRFFTGQACVHGHLVERFTSSNACVVCARRNARKWCAKNIDRTRAYGIKSYAKNREAQVESARQYRKQFPEKANESTKKWRAANKSLVAAHGSAARARLLRATPSWVNIKDVAEIYQKRDEIAETTGMPHHVDHIVPLKNPLVCGLHVPWNLRVIPAKENQQKKNRLIDV